MPQVDHPEPTSSPETSLVCHCRRVSYRTVLDTVRTGRARSLAALQRETTACTRCFGCRFELEGLLERELGDAYRPADVALLPQLPAAPGTQPRRRGGLVGRLRPKVAPKYAVESPVQRMYMPVLQGFGWSAVRTRAIFFNWPEGDEEPAPVPVRVDLLSLDGRRLAVWERDVRPRCSAVVEVAELVRRTSLPGGVGVLKAVVQSAAVASLRPYFHLETPGGITTTHEKKAPRKLSTSRPYFWVFQLAAASPPQDAFFFLTNTQTIVLDDHELIWQGEDGCEVVIPLPRLELDQSVCVALHEHVEALRDGSAAGTVRLNPPAHVAGFQLRHDRSADLWRVQHL